MGSWNLQPTELDTTGVHAAVLPNGEVLYFSYDMQDENNVDRCNWQLCDEDRGPITPMSLILSRNLFCSGHCWLGDGRILVAGGQSWNFFSQWNEGADHDIHTFDPKLSSWTKHPNMPAGRYYPTCVTLSNGNGLIIGGAWSRVPVNRVNHEAEIFDWKTNTLSPRIPFNPGFIEDLYPFLQLLPDKTEQGLLWIHSGKKARLFSLVSGTWLSSTFNTNNEGNRNYPKQGAPVLLPLLPEEGYKARILLVGGGSTTEEATDIAQIFDFNSEDPASSTYRDPLGGNPNHRRFMSDAILLANGSVLICGGAGHGSADDSHDPVLESEIFDPATETFHIDATINRQRMYHASSVLLPSGRVALAGHTEHWNPAHPSEDKTIDIYTPDYLTRGPQPSLQSVPLTIAYGQLVELVTPDVARIDKVALVRASTTTHSNNMDQRWIGLVIEQRRTDRLFIRVPNERALAPPGHYMIFIINSNGVPSVARFTFLDSELHSPDNVLSVDNWITIREEDEDVDTGIIYEPGDEYELKGEGEIWAGVWATGKNGPAGWHNVDHDSKFPLHEGSNAHPYALLGKFGDGEWFYVGSRLGPISYHQQDNRKLILRINDDSPGNGNGEFHCRVRVWRNSNVAQITISGVVANPPGSDVSNSIGEYVTLRNAGHRDVDLSGWRLEDTAGHKLFIIRPRTIASRASLRIYTGPGNDNEDSYFCGRLAAVWNNNGDNITLYSPDGQVRSTLSY
jgi:hypothetical protein